MRSALLITLTLIMFSCVDEILNPNRPPSDIDLFEPDNGEQFGSRNPDFRWRGGLDVDGDQVLYRLIILKDGGVYREYPNLDTAFFRMEDTLQYETDFSWQVIARDTEGNTSESEVWRFKVKPDVPPSPPVQLVPPNNSGNKEIPLRLVWTKSEGSPNETILYDIYLDKDDADSLYLGNFEKDTLVLGSFLQPNTSYFWRIVAKDPDGYEIPSTTWIFSTK